MCSTEKSAIFCQRRPAGRRRRTNWASAPSSSGWWLHWLSPVDGNIMTTQKQRIAISVIVNLHNHSFCADFVQRQDSHRPTERQRDPLVELTWTAQFRMLVHSKGSIYFHHHKVVENPRGLTPLLTITFKLLSCSPTVLLIRHESNAESIQS